MDSLPATPRPPWAFGMTSLVLGTVGLMLFFFPVLGIPISACGLLLGILGVATSWAVGGVRLRWSLAGFAVSALALGVTVALAWAPDYHFREKPPQPAHGSPDTPTVSPPER